MCRVGVSNEVCSSSVAIGLSKDCKRVFNEASLTPWCHAVVHFEVKMSRFPSSVQKNHMDTGGS